MKSILTIAFSTFIAISIVAICFREPNPIPVSVENAKDALMQLQEWAKWMAGLQTAAIAALWLLRGAPTFVRNIPSRSEHTLAAFLTATYVGIQSWLADGQQLTNLLDC